MLWNGTVCSSFLHVCFHPHVSFVSKGSWSSTLHSSFPVILLLLLSAAPEHTLHLSLHTKSSPSYSLSPLAHGSTLFSFPVLLFKHVASTVCSPATALCLFHPSPWTSSYFVNLQPCSFFCFRLFASTLCIWAGQTTQHRMNVNEWLLRNKTLRLMWVRQKHLSINAPFAFLSFYGFFF